MTVDYAVVMLLNFPLSRVKKIRRAVRVLTSIGFSAHEALDIILSRLDR